MNRRHRTARVTDAPSPMRAAWLVLPLAFLGCKRPTGAPSVDGGADAGGHASTSSSIPPRSSASAARSADPVRADFEDHFAYVTGDAGADPGRLTMAEGFVDYQNERFGFMVAVPKVLVAEREPTNGDGRQWRLGRQVSMIASGMMWVFDEPVALCTHSANVTAQRKTKDGCWATGKRDGYVFWERFALKNEVLYSLRFQYAESLKEAMDPIVTKVNASFVY